MQSTHGRPTVAEVSLGALARQSVARRSALVGARVGVMAVVKADAYGHGAVAGGARVPRRRARRCSASSTRRRRPSSSGARASTAPIVVLGGVVPGRGGATSSSTTSPSACGRSTTRARARRGGARAGRAVRRAREGRHRHDAARGRRRPTCARSARRCATSPGVARRGRLLALRDGRRRRHGAPAQAQLARFADAVEALAAARLRPPLVHLANSAAVLVAAGGALHARAARASCSTAARRRRTSRRARRCGRRMRLRTARRADASRAGGTRRRLRRHVRHAPRRASSRRCRSAMPTATTALALEPRRGAGARRARADRGARLHGSRHARRDRRAGRRRRRRGRRRRARRRARRAADEVAGWCETIAYEVLTRVGKRVPRVYVEEFGWPRIEAGAAERQRQERARRVRARPRARSASRSSRPAARRSCSPTPGSPVDAGERLHRLPRDARRPREDAAPEDPRRPPRPPRRPEHMAAMQRARHRADRPRGRESLPVRGDGREAGRHARGGDREHRHRRPVDAPLGGEEPRERHRARRSRRLRAGARRAASDGRRGVAPRPTAAWRRRPSTPPRLRRRDRRLPRRVARRRRFGETFHWGGTKALDLRYGENPHQQAALYGDFLRIAEPLHGKELSYNNVVDVDAALALALEFLGDADAAVAILKHNTPCGVGSARDPLEAWQRAYATDPESPFGGIVVVNRRGRSRWRRSSTRSSPRC